MEEEVIAQIEKELEKALFRPIDQGTAQMNLFLSNKKKAGEIQRFDIFQKVATVPQLLIQVTLPGGRVVRLSTEDICSTL